MLGENKREFYLQNSPPYSLTMIILPGTLITNDKYVLDSFRNLLGCQLKSKIRSSQGKLISPNLYYILHKKHIIENHCKIKASIRFIISGALSDA